jgi:hypothetical protein
VLCLWCMWFLPVERNLDRNVYETVDKQPAKAYVERRLIFTAWQILCPLTNKAHDRFKEPGLAIRQISMIRNNSELI